ncbi:MULTISPECIES: hypothetical protein [unclassified Brevundimonas]|uniref:hypothetical protein n=1 Tax=unclassified Brevundimonas TaxID=2622653 RepID=UPI0025B7E211|nr:MULTISPECIES: hypothetical protein [unclassified Brevundimonas]
MDRVYNFSIVIDGRSFLSKLYAADDGAARGQALMATSEALRDYAFQGRLLTTLTVGVAATNGECIFEARVAVA